MKPNLFRELALLLLVCVFASCDKQKKLAEANDINKAIESTYDMPPEGQVRVLDSISESLYPLKNDSITRAIVNKVTSYYAEAGNLPKYRKSILRLKELSEEKGDTARLASSMFFMGEYFDQRNKPDSSLYYYLQAENMFGKVHDTLAKGRTMLYTASVLYYSGSFAETEVQVVKALNLLKGTKDATQLHSAYVMLATTLNEMKNYSKALDYFDQAMAQIKVLEKEGADPELIIEYKASVYNDMGTIYEAQQEYDTAITIYNRGLALHDIKEQSKVYAMLISNRAYSEMLGEDPGPGVLRDLLKAKHIRDSIGHKSGIVASEIRIGEYYLQDHDTTAGVKCLKKGLALAKDIKSSYDVTRALSLLAVSDRTNNRHYSQEYFRITDSLHQAERATRNKFARIEYETDRIEQQNKLLNRRFKFILSAGGVLLVFAIGLFVIIRLRAKNRELRHAREQQMANEKIYTLLMKQEAEAENAKLAERNRLAMELHDGVINRIFTTRFNLMQLDSGNEEKKKQLVQELQDTQEELRQLSHDLKESFIAENESFAGAVKELIQKQQDNTGLTFDLYVDKYINWSNVPLESRVAIFRIIQEACTNAKKHSAAQNCHIALMAQGELIKLRIWDDGRGFDPKKEKPGIGLKNMSDRITALGGAFNLKSAPGNGTVLEITV